MRTFKEEYVAIKAEAANSEVYKALDRIGATLNSRQLVLYGAGAWGRKFLALCRERNLEVSCFCDREAKVQLEDIEVITPDTLKAKYSKAIILVASPLFNDEICATLNRLCFPPEQIVPFYGLKFPYLFLSMCEFEAHVDGYKWAYDIFKDERSKQLVLDRIRLILCDYALGPNTSCDLYYEDDFIKLGDNEVFVDGGAYDGDTADQFLIKIKNRGNNYQVHSFEPEKVHCEKAVLRLSNIPNVAVVPKGLWSSETELVFYPSILSNSSFFFNLTGIPCASTARPDIPPKFQVPVTSLDFYFKNKPDNEWPTFIKMDIEGSEREALLGSAEIIRKRKPKLAICVYHKLDDIYELPKTIHDIRDDYRFGLRQHSIGSTCAVLYAV